MIGPKKISRRLPQSPQPLSYCQNPMCGAKLAASRTRKGAKYCDQVCHREHSRILKLERRPKDLVCSNPNCKKPLDPLSRGPRDWQKTSLHFCDGICYDEFCRLTGKYADMGQKGVEAMRAYHTKHGQVVNYQERAEVVSVNNTSAPPKAKYFIRKGKAWGYDVTSYPNEDGDGYRTSIAELPELGVIQAKTHKECLRLMRARFLEYRETVRSKQEQEQAEALLDSIDAQLNDEEFTDLYNAVKVGIDPRKCPGYQKAEKLFTLDYGMRMSESLETAFDRTMERRFSTQEKGRPQEA